MASAKTCCSGYKSQLVALLVNAEGAMRGGGGKGWEDGEEQRAGGEGETEGAR